MLSLILIDKHSVRFVSKQLEAHENTLYRWGAEYEQYVERAFSGRGSREFAAQKENKRLEKEYRRLKEALALLKKFQIFLKQNHR
ncbi:hypothetical protein D8X97_05520 [Listeria ivanovii]|nr:transposase [Listeria ivanovii FSL F6-596]MBM5607721.1 hypothetical protein [Listeria ivanovii]MBM5637815.1 hypothetical protein [Listeria ivanovii]MBM5705447.1 hypothetical protein [Listeria ivanovii]MBM5719734.1 hypothetical protein [Listeria ivanovii]